MFCPICQLAFSEHTLLDPSLRGYACGNGHVFYSTLVEQFGGIPTADTIQPPPMSHDIQILKFWLTDGQARERLPNELALVCRRIVEIAESGLHVAKVEDAFVFCPMCAETLAPFDSDDLYMQGLRCSNGHECWSRGRTVRFIEDSARANLSVELDDDYMPTLIDFYASNDELIRPYVHPQVRGVLKRLGR